MPKSPIHTPNPPEPRRDADWWRKQSVHEFNGDPKLAWTVGDAVEGTQVFGATGSGKSSGSGRALATGFLKLGFGGLVLTAKPDELANWVGYFRESGRSLDDLIVLQPRGPAPEGMLWPNSLDPQHCRHTFNFIDYESARGGGLTQNLVSLLVTTLSSNGADSSRSDPYWTETLHELLTHAVDLARYGTRVSEGKPVVRLADLFQIVRTAPQTKAEALSPVWRDPKRSLCWKFVAAARDWALGQPSDSPEVRDLDQTLQYWMSDFAGLDDRTRSGIVSSFTAKTAGLLRSPIRELLCGDDDGAAADPTLTHAGKVIVVNLPVMLYGEVGKLSQVIYKTIWQRATHRRTGKLQNTTAWRPVFLWADESQYFIRQEDMLYQQTARAAMAATVYLTQNISNYYAVMGGHGGRSAADSLLGNLQTKIFHANGDPATNEWAERLFGTWEADKYSQTSNQSHDAGSTAGGASRTRQGVRVPVCEARRFTMLSKGGPPANTVSGIVFTAGPARIANSNYLLARFRQASNDDHPGTTV